MLVQTIKHAEVHAETAKVLLSAGSFVCRRGRTADDRQRIRRMQASALDIRTPETDSPVIGGAIVHGTGQEREGYSRGSGIGSDRGIGGGIGDKIGRGTGHRGSGDLSLGENVAKVVQSSRVGEDRLGAVLEGDAQSPAGHIRIVRLKHSLSDWWQDPSAIPSFAKWLEEKRLRVDMITPAAAWH